MREILLQSLQQWFTLPDFLAVLYIWVDGNVESELHSSQDIFWFLIRHSFPDITINGPLVIFIFLVHRRNPIILISVLNLCVTLFTPW